MTGDGSVFRESQIYNPIAVLRRDDEVLYVAQVGMKTSRQFMILNETSEPAWPHEPLGSLSDVAWALRAHRWDANTLEPVGSHERQAKMLTRLLTERA